MTIYRVIDGKPFVIVSWNTDWYVDQAIRRLTTFRQGNLGILITELLRIGLPQLEGLPDPERAALLVRPLQMKVRLTGTIPQELDTLIRQHSRDWQVPIYQVFTEALKQGLAHRGDEQPESG